MGLKGVGGQNEYDQNVLYEILQELKKKVDESWELQLRLASGRHTCAHAYTCTFMDMYVVEYEINK